MRGSTMARIAPLLAAALLLTAACGGAGDDGDAATTTSEVTSYSGIVVDPPVQVGALAIPAADGSGDHPFVAPAGGLELVYFGYTFCPDVCPTTMSDVRKALAELPGDEAERVGVAMVTIDPARDTAEVLDGYVTNFVDDGVALRTDDDPALRAVTDAFGADYEVTTDDEGDIEVSHTGELYAVDDSGTVVMQWPFGTTYESLARDLRSLLAEAEQA
jgi:protein SCO1/2